MRRDNNDAVVSLARMAAELVSEIRSAATTERSREIRASMADAIKLLARYLDLLQGGLARNSAADALKGANLMGSFSRGLSDMAWIDRHDDVRALALKASNAGLATAKGLRAELGMGF